MIEKLIKDRVQLDGYENWGPEPSIYELVHRYYGKYFTPEETTALVEKYFEKWAKDNNLEDIV